MTDAPETPELPPLPEPSKNFGACEFTAAQMHAFRAEGVREAVQREREMCAKACDDRADTWGPEQEWNWRREESMHCAAAIRERGKT